MTYQAAEEADTNSFGTDDPGVCAPLSLSTKYQPLPCPGHLQRSRALAPWLTWSLQLPLRQQPCPQTDGDTELQWLVLGLVCLLTGVLAVNILAHFTECTRIHCAHTTHTCTYTHTYARIHTHICTYTHTHTLLPQNMRQLVPPVP